MMAKSLFASSMSCTKLEPPIVLQEFSHELLKKEGHNFYGTGHVYGHFYDFQKTSSECTICMKIGLHLTCNKSHIFCFAVDVLTNRYFPALFIEVMF